MQNNMFQMMMNQIMMKNPQAKQLYDSLRGKSTEELKQYAENVAKGKGVNLQEFLASYGLRY